MAQHYDVVVIGAQNAGLITAALLAKRGRRVLWLDHGEEGAAYKRHGIALPLSPTLLPSLDSSPHVQRVHDELGLGPELRASLRPLEPAFQAILPEHRLDVYAEPTRFLGEIRAEFPDIAPVVAEFFEKLFALDAEISSFLNRAPPLPPRGIYQRLRARSLLSHAAHLDAPFESHELFAKIPPQHPIREILLGPLAFFGYLMPEAPSTFHAVRLMARYFRGACTFGAQVGNFQYLWQKTAERAGVELRRDVTVQCLLGHGKKLKSVLLDDGKTTVTADYFVNSAFGTFADLLPPEPRAQRYAAEESNVRPVGSLLTLNLLVRKDVIPMGMSQAMFLLNGRRQQRGEEAADPPVFLRRYPVLDDASSNLPKAADHEIISVACPVRTVQVAHSPERFDKLKEQLLWRVGRLVPFLNKYIEDVSAPAETHTWDRHTSSANQRIDPWTIHPIYETAKRPLLGVAARSTYTHYKNLVRCGFDVVPGLGVEGEYYSGLNAANALCELAKSTWQHPSRRRLQLN